MNLVIEFFKEDESVLIRDIPANANRGALKLYYQIAYAHTGNKFPVMFNINLEEGQPPYKAGQYSLSQESFTVGQYDRFELARRLILVPIQK
ncbi:MAG: helix-destabilizing protein [Inoviridae sp.]|nr:MAG: helix-destabilizing protein [Inoviridae sp.]